MARMKEMAMDIAERYDIELHEVNDEMVNEHLHSIATVALSSDKISDKERIRWTEYLEKAETC